jgi:hypothetical protein
VHSERIITHAESKDNICGELAVVGVSHGLDRTPVEESWQANRSPGLDSGIPFQRFSAIAKRQDLMPSVVFCVYLPFTVSAQEVPGHLIRTTARIEAKGDPLVQQHIPGAPRQLDKLLPFFF